MRIGVLIQTRERSGLGPDCRLATLGHRSVIHHVLQRIRGVAGLEGCAIVTGTDQRDQGVADFARFQGVACFRGPSDRPGQALSLAASKLQWDALVSIRSDSPFLSTDLLNHALTLFRASDFELLSIGQDQGFPQGQEIEILKTRLLVSRAPLIRMPDARQGLAQWFHRLVNPGLTGSWESTSDWSDVSMAIETLHDLEWMRWLLQSIGPSIWNVSWTSLASQIRQLRDSRLGLDEAAA